MLPTTASRPRRKSKVPGSCHISSNRGKGGEGKPICIARMQLYFPCRLSCAAARCSGGTHGYPPSCRKAAGPQLLSITTVPTSCQDTTILPSQPFVLRGASWQALLSILVECFGLAVAKHGLFCSQRPTAAAILPKLSSLCKRTQSLAVRQLVATMSPHKVSSSRYDIRLG